jgi:hypothetical protein
LVARLRRTDQWSDLPFGVLMVSAYAWRRDLVANATAHVVLLLLGMLTL